MSGDFPAVFLVEDNPADIFFMRAALESEGIGSEIVIAQMGRKLSNLSRLQTPIRQRPVLKSYFWI